MQTFFIAPTDFGVGLTSISLGLVRTLERGGLKVGFFKPVAQPHPGDTGPERSTELIARTHGIRPPAPLSLAYVERMLGEGQLDELLEESLRRYQEACIGHDVVVVEGMVPTRHASYAARVNLHLAKSLDADVILVAAAEQEAPGELFSRVELQAQLYGGPRDPKVLGVILNKVRSEDGMTGFAERLRAHSPLLRGDDFRLLGCIPFQPELNAPRTRDVADLMGAQVLNAGDYEHRRMSKIILCARTVANTVPLLTPGTLVVTPGDRDDIILAVSLAAINGVPLAGLLLTSDSKPDPRILELCRGALQAGLPILSVGSGSYDTANRLNALNREIPVDDRERAEVITDFVASHLDAPWLHQRCGTPREMRLSPAVFRYQLIQRAQLANKRIILPEGAEPLLVQAAAQCQARGIARCVLLAKPEAVQAVARAQGISLPDDLEILDPDLIRARYVEPMVELRKGRNLNAPMAEQQLEDPVVLATVMLALGEVDGLVSGLVHSTANTIRPALQLIKTAPGSSLVSSVFFMLFPEQVLMYGDCIMNPHPSADELAEIARQSAESAKAFGIAPRVAMLSDAGDATAGSGEIEKVREATRLAQQADSELLVDGPLPYDAAANPAIAGELAPHSAVAGKATVFVFPDLNTGNTTHKAVQRSADCVSLGPMLQGLRKPVNDLPRGAQVDDIVHTIALTAIQASRVE